MIKKPEPDGFLTIRIAGHEVEVNAYRDSTMEAYAQARVDADLQGIADRLYKLSQAAEEKYSVNLSHFHEGRAIAFGVARDMVLLEIRALKGKV